MSSFFIIRRWYHYYLFSFIFIYLFLFQETNKYSKGRKNCQKYNWRDTKKMIRRVTYMLLAVLLLSEIIQVTSRRCIRVGYRCIDRGCNRRGQNFTCLRVGSRCRCQSSRLVGSGHISTEHLNQFKYPWKYNDCWSHTMYG